MHIETSVAHRDDSDDEDDGDEYDFEQYAAHNHRQAESNHWTLAERSMMTHTNTFGIEVSEEDEEYDSPTWEDRRGAILYPNENTIHNELVASGEGARMERDLEVLDVRGSDELDMETASEVGDWDEEEDFLPTEDEKVNGEDEYYEDITHEIEASVSSDPSMLLVRH